MPEEYLDERSPMRARRQGLGSLGSRVVSLAVIGTVAAVISDILTLIALHDNPVTIALGIVAGGFVLLWLGAEWVPRFVPAADPDRYREWKLDRLARRIEHGPPGLQEQLPSVRYAHSLVKDLATHLKDDGRLCVIRLNREDTFEVPPGIAGDAIPQSSQCESIVGHIGWQLEKATELGEDAKDVAADLRAVLRHASRAEDPMATLRHQVARTLRTYRLAGPREKLRFVPLADVLAEDLQGPVGEWLITLLKEDLGCTYGVFTEEPDDPDPPDIPPGGSAGRGSVRKYVTRMLSRRLPEAEVSAVFEPLLYTTGGDMDLIKARCAIIAAAADFDEHAEALDQLRNPREPVPSSPPARKRDCVLAFRWLVGRKTSRIARAARDLPAAFDRLAVIGRVTREIFDELMRDLGLTAEGAGELFTWLDSEEFRVAGLVENHEGEIRLTRSIGDDAVAWLRTDEPAAYQDAQIAVERYYRVRLVLNRADVPDLGYADLVAEGYGGLHLYEIPDWWKNLYTWGGHAAEISAPEYRKDAGIAIVCLFFETWWWWGDQLRLSDVDKVLTVAREILRDQPQWIDALDEFDHNYEPMLDQRASAGDRWQHVANALSFFSGNLGLRQGEVPGDPVLARIYICWCFFSGDVAQQTGDLEAADRWFRQAGEACGDDQDNAAMRAFADYQRADVWIPADPDRSMTLIRESGLAGQAAELEDLSLHAYLARMYGDIRWESGDIRGAFDAYGRMLLHAYVYQVDQESEKMPPSKYTYALYEEMRTRLLQRLDEARAGHYASEADAATQRIRTLFGPYWERTGRSAAAPGDDPLAGVVPPLPDESVLSTFESDYASDALAMLHDKLKDEVAKPVDQPL